MINRTFFVKLAVCILLLSAMTPQAAPQLRLLIIGDSVSFGLAASSEETTYRALLTTALDADTTYIRATTLISVPEQLPDADIIVLEVGLNDVLQGDAAPIQEEDWPAAYGAALERLKEHAPIVIAATTPHLLYSAHARYDQMDRYAGYVRSAAAAHGVRLADLWAIEACIPVCLSQESDYTPFPPLYHGDGFHPNDLGHWRIVQVVLRAIKGNNVYAPLFVVGE